MEKPRRHKDRQLNPYLQAQFGFFLINDYLFTKFSPYTLPSGERKEIACSYFLKSPVATYRDLPEWQRLLFKEFELA